MTILTVPGAQLHYTTQGQGPLLLLIPGANGDGVIFQPVARGLAERFTVVTYDRRGFSSSPLEGGRIAEDRLRTDADDVRRLIEHLGGPDATVFGSSSGAVIALQVLLRHPSVVRTLVSHEPPALALLPDREQWRSAFEGVYATYRRTGLPQALREFAEVAMGPQAGPELLRVREERKGEHVVRNTQHWLEHEMRQYSGAALDVEALRPHRDRLMLVVGRDSRGQRLIHEPSSLLAQRLGLTLHELPGAHLGYASHPVEFAAELLALLSGRNVPASSSAP